MFRSTCFGRLHAHHQELTAALTASGFTLERGGSSVVGRGLDHNQQRCYHHVPRQKQRLLMQFMLLMMGVEAPETC
jgi:hypothetical protein